MKALLAIVGPTERITLETSLSFPGHVPPHVGDYFQFGPMSLMVGKRVFECGVCRLEFVTVTLSKTELVVRAVQDLERRSWQVSERSSL